MSRRAISNALSSRWAPVAVLVLGLVCTIVVVFQLRRGAAEQDRLRFQNAAQRHEDAIKKRFESFYSLLHATAGFIGGNPDVLRDKKFATYGSHMRMEQNYRGAVGVGFARRVLPQELPKYIGQMKEFRNSQYTVRPAGARDEWNLVQFQSTVKPHSDSNWLGVDMSADPVKREAMLRAKESSEPAATRKLVLTAAEGADTAPGFLLYLPVYRETATAEQIAARLDEFLIGYVFVTINIDDLFHSIYFVEQPRDAAFSIYDGSVEDDRALLFRSEPPSAAGFTSNFTYTGTMSIAGRKWTLAARSTPEFQSTSFTPRFAEMAAVGGLLATLLLTSLTALQTRARLIADTQRQSAARAESAARTSAERLELVLKGARVGLWYSTLPFETLQWDERVKAHFFMPPNETEVTVERAFARVHPDDRERIRAAMGWSIREHAPFDVEYRTVSPDGTRMNWIRSIGQTFVDDEGKPIRFDVLTIDVTSLKQSQETLAESESRFRQLANSIPQLAWIASPDGSMLWFNERWYEYTGAKPQDMEGWGWKSVGDPAYMPVVLAKWQNAIATGQPLEMEFPIRAANGQFGWFLTRAFPLTDPSGKVLFWFGTNTDLTEQRRLSEDREQLLESERAARSLAERTSRLKDEFLATLSHELRTPLNAILGWAQILRRQNASNKDLTDGLSVIERNARVQTQLVSDLLDMSRVISGKLRLESSVVDPAAIVTTAVESIQPAADAKEITIIKELDPQAGPIHGDPSRLQQIVWNLLSNAIKFTRKGGLVKLVLERNKDHVLLSVMDNGEGIRAEFLPHLFERFRQADGSTTRRHGGLGLGLAIVKNLTELHGGKVWAASAGPGEGASFFVELPLLHEAGGQGELQDLTNGNLQSMEFLSAAELHDSLTGTTVLVVDDEPDARDLVRRVLNEAGAEVLSASGGREALSILDERKPDVIISDIGMPDQDGYQFIRAVRELPIERGGRIPAAALTAFARSQDRRRALQAGYQSHISKPVESAELITVISALIGKTGRVKTAAV